MAISTEDQQILPQTPMTPTQKKRSRSNSSSSNKALQPQPSNNHHNHADLSDSSSCSSSPSRSPPTKKKTRRRRKKSSTSSTPKPIECELSQEEKDQYLAMDCEMVGVGVNGFKSALARVTIVDWDGQVVLDQYVKPSEPVTDFRTFVSGITQDDLEHASDLAACRVKVTEVLQDKILVGHGLKNDLTVLGVRHPWFMTRDTAKWEPFMKVRFDDNILWPRKLKDLCQEKLKKDIQVFGQSHCPIEDAVAALDLYKLVRNKWEKAMVYKINKTKEITQQQKQ